MKALAQLGVSKFAAEGVSRQGDSCSGSGDSQLVSVGIAPLRRGDQQIATEATLLMINKCTGCRTHAQLDCRRQIGFGIDIAAGIGNRRSDRFGSKIHRAGSVVGCSRSALELWGEFDVVCYEHGGPDA